MYLTAIRTTRGWRECGPCGPTKDVKDKPNATAAWFANTYAPFIMKKPVRLCILALFTALFATQTYLWFEDTEVGARNSDILKDGTYQRDFYVRSDADYGAFTADFVT